MQAQTKEKTNKTCFIVLPSDRRLTGLYEYVIAPAVASVGLTAVRTDDFVNNEPLGTYVRSALEEALLVIADVSGRNPTVLFELGIAYALGKPILILAQETREIPFDVQHYRSFTYRPDDLRGYGMLRSNLERAMQIIVDEELRRTGSKPVAQETAEQSQKRLEGILNWVSKAQGAGNHRQAARLLQEEAIREVCEVFFWRYAIPLFTVTYEPFWKGD